VTRLRAVRDAETTGSAVSGAGKRIASDLAAVAAGRDIILEGPPGTSKNTLLRAITAE
jgi:MoxR-like ATPase